MGADVRDEGGNSSSVNLPDLAPLTRHDHVVAKCAHMVEGNSGVVLSAVWHQCKRRDSAPRDFIDPRALCDENIPRGEPGADGLRRSDSHVFFSAVTDP